jgi:WD40 repeat protein
LEGHAGHVTRVAFSPNGRLALSGGYEGTMRLWDIETGEQRHCFEGHQGAVYGVTFSPDGRLALSGGEDKTIRIWRVPE